MQTLSDLPDIKDKIILLRLDLNVPVDDDGNVTDTTRINRVRDTVLELAGKGAKIAIFSYLGRPKGPDPKYSLSILPPVLKESWGIEVGFSDDALKEPDFTDTNIVLMENVRFYPEEHDCTPEHTAKLAGGVGDFFVFDAFSVAHRNHCSIVGLAHALPSYVGRALEAELSALNTALGDPDRPVAAIVGGAKISTKLAVLNNLIEKVDILILGGGMANTFLYACAASMGASLHEPDMKDQVLDILAKAQTNGCSILLPVDGKAAAEFKADAPYDEIPMTAIPDDKMVLDIGTGTIEAVKGLLDQCQTLVWNGPMGAFEIAPFDEGTTAIARYAAEKVLKGDLKVIAGGGDTVAALAHAGVVQDMTYVSTAGGAFLEWMEGKELPALKALEIIDEAA